MNQQPYIIIGVILGRTGKERVKERIQKENQAYGRNKLLLNSKKLSRTQMNVLIMYCREKYDKQKTIERLKKIRKKDKGYSWF